MQELNELLEAILLIKSKKELEDFSDELKKLILQRDGYRCVICERSNKEGYELHVDHIFFT